MVVATRVKVNRREQDIKGIKMYWWSYLKEAYFVHKYTSNATERKCYYYPAPITRFQFLTREFMPLIFPILACASHPFPPSYSIQQGHLTRFSSLQIVIEDLSALYPGG